MYIESIFSHPKNLSTLSIFLCFYTLFSLDSFFMEIYQKLGKGRSSSRRFERKFDAQPSAATRIRKKKIPKRGG